MQVNLDVIDWKALKEAGSIDEFLESASEDVQISGLDIGWDSDSASLYFQVGMSVEAVLDALPSDQADAVRTGLLPLISENKQVNESGEESDVYFIAASPQTVAKIHQALSKIDLRNLAAVVKKESPEDAEEILEDLDGNFIDFIEQFRGVIRVAAAKNMGILGSCG